MLLFGLACSISIQRNMVKPKKTISWICTAFSLQKLVAVQVPTVYSICNQATKFSLDQMDKCRSNKLFLDNAAIQEHFTGQKMAKAIFKREKRTTTFKKEIMKLSLPLLNKKVKIWLPTVKLQPAKVKIQSWEFDKFATSSPELIFISIKIMEYMSHGTVNATVYWLWSSVGALA